MFQAIPSTGDRGIVYKIPTLSSTVIKWKTKKYHTVETIPSSNRKIEDRSAIDTGLWPTP